jgi:hypothetical protein
MEYLLNSTRAGFGVGFCLVAALTSGCGHPVTKANQQRTTGDSYYKNRQYTAAEDSYQKAYQAYDFSIYLADIGDAYTMASTSPSDQRKATKYYAKALAEELQRSLDSTGGDPGWVKALSVLAVGLSGVADAQNARNGVQSDNLSRTMAATNNLTFQQAIGSGDYRRTVEQVSKDLRALQSHPNSSLTVINADPNHPDVPGYGMVKLVAGGHICPSIVFYEKLRLAPLGCVGGTDALNASDSMLVRGFGLSQHDIKPVDWWRTTRGRSVVAISEENQEGQVSIDDRVLSGDDWTFFWNKLDAWSDWQRQHDGQRYAVTYFSPELQNIVPVLSRCDGGTETCDLGGAAWGVLWTVNGDGEEWHVVGFIDSGHTVAWSAIPNYAAQKWRSGS